MRQIRGPVVAIDGPAGSGKSTVAREASARLSLPHIDTGAIYRALTLKAVRARIALGDGAALAGLADRTRIELDEDRVIVDGEDVTLQIREAEVTASVSQVSSHLEVRERMVAVQRELVGDGGAVVEGRDIGTVVLPDADIKIFLTAAPEERARRRAAELAGRGPAEVLGEILERDRSDSERAASPLAIPKGAVVIDSTGRVVEEIVDEIERLVEGRDR